MSLRRPIPRSGSVPRWAPTSTSPGPGGPPRPTRERAATTTTPASTTGTGRSSTCPATGGPPLPSPSGTARCSTGRRSPTPDARSAAESDERRTWLSPRRGLLHQRRLARRHLPGRHRGLLLPARLRDHRATGGRRRARSRRRGGLPAADRTCDAKAQPHRGLPALGPPRPGLEPRRHLAAGAARAVRTGAHPPLAGRAAATSPTSAPSSSCGPCSTRVEARTGRARHHHHATTAGGTSVEDRARSHSRPARTGVEWTVSVPSPAAGGPGRWATSLSTTCRSRSVDRGRRRQRRAHAGRSACARSRSADWICDGQRRAAVPEGGEPGPHPHGPGRGRAGRDRPATCDLAARRRASTSSGCTPTSAGPSSTTRPTRPGCCCGRTCRCSGATAAASAARPDARPARRSTCWPTTPPSFVWCGHNEPMAARHRARADRRAGTPAAASRRGWPRPRPCRRWNRTLLDRSIEDRARAQRRHPAGDRPLRACSRTCPSSTAPTPTSTSAGIFGDERDLAEPAARWPRTGPLRDRVRRPGRARARRVRRTGRAGPTSTGTAARPAPRAAEADVRPLRAARRLPDLRGLEGGDPGTTRPGSIRYHIETLRRLKYRPTGGFAQFCLADSAPAVTLRRCSTTSARPKPGFAALRQACRPVIVVADRPPEHVPPRRSPRARRPRRQRHARIASTAISSSTAHLSDGDGSDRAHRWTLAGRPPGRRLPIRIGSRRHRRSPTDRRRRIVLDLVLTGPGLPRHQPVRHLGGPSAARALIRGSRRPGGFAPRRSHRWASVSPGRRPAAVGVRPVGHRASHRLPAAHRQPDRRSVRDRNPAASAAAQPGHLGQADPQAPGRDASRSLVELWQIGGGQEVGDGAHRRRADAVRLRAHDRQPEDVPRAGGVRPLQRVPAASCWCRSCPAR